jgi:hypothetical protein
LASNDISHDGFKDGDTAKAQADRDKAAELEKQTAKP